MPELIIETSPDVAGRQAPLSGIWVLSYDTITLVDAAWTGRPLVLVPSEDVLILAVDLPIANRTQRAAALPFAVEDEVSEPIEALHTALGLELSPGRYLAGVIRHERMMQWCALLAAEGLEGAAILPDALALPRPGTGHWTVAAEDQRIRVRTPQGSAFAVPSAAFRGVWEAADRPQLVSYGQPLPDEFASEPAGPGWTGPATIAGAIPLDLRQGRYAPRSMRSPWARRLSLVALLGVLAHAAIYSVDTVMLMRSADARRDEVVKLVAAAGGPVGGDLVATAEAMLPRTGGSTGLLPLFGRAARALQPVAQTVAIQSVAYENATGLSLELEASDLAGLQQAEAALRGGGLEPASTGSAVEGGRASQTITLAPTGGGQ